MCIPMNECMNECIAGMAGDGVSTGLSIPDHLGPILTIPSSMRVFYLAVIHS